MHGLKKYKICLLKHFTDRSKHARLAKNSIFRDRKTATM
jgi:hypothetical protein